MPDSLNNFSQVFISPHFDDCVLSCGGTIHQLIQSGESACVMTMMGGLFYGELPDTPILADLHQRWEAGDNPLLTRQIEDQNALTALGSNFVHVPLTDCVYRVTDECALYPSEESLFGEVHPQDYAPTFLADIALPFKDNVQTVYIPLGVGHHVDHQIVRDWGIKLLAKKHVDIRVKFYAEYPYLNTDNAIQQALSLVDLSLSANHVILEATDIQAKVDAITHYKSQISTFWEGLDAMEADVRQSSTDPESGAYVERFWDIS